MSDPAIVQLMLVVDYKSHVEDALHSSLMTPEALHYRERILAATGDAVDALARAAAGDAQGVAELRVCRARLGLWTFAHAEHSRRAVVAALRAWLSEAAAAAVAVAGPLIEAGLRALVESGMNAL